MRELKRRRTLLRKKRGDHMGRRRESDQHDVDSVEMVFTPHEQPTRRGSSGGVDYKNEFLPGHIPFSATNPGQPEVKLLGGGAVSTHTPTDKRADKMVEKPVSTYCAEHNSWTCGCDKPASKAPTSRVWCGFCYSYDCRCHTKKTTTATTTYPPGWSEWCIKHQKYKSECKCPLRPVGDQWCYTHQKYKSECKCPVTEYKPPPPHPKHDGNPIKVGGYTVLAGGTRDLKSADYDKADIIIPLTNTSMPDFMFGKYYRVLAAPMVDYGGVPTNWKPFLEEVVIPLIKGGKTILAFCVGSHGRTGTFLASLIALMETKEETPDPIAAVRERHCTKCVESKKQAEAIFALRGEVLPKKYAEEFKFSKFGTTYGTTYDFGTTDVKQKYKTGRYGVYHGGRGKNARTANWAF